MTERPETHPSFHRLFERWARRVRTRLALRRMFAGAAVGLAVALIPASLAWKMRWPDVRLAAPALGALGLFGGWAFAHRKRWSDTDVALFLDARLETEEAIATAVELGPDAVDAAVDPARAVVISTAVRALVGESGARARPMLWKPVHALAPFALVGLVWVIRQPFPALPVPATTPGTARVQLTQVEGLERVAKLGQLSARDEAQRERLDAIAKEAESLKEELRKGMEKRDAQDKIARLREQLAQERLSLGEGEERAGLESAVSKLEESETTKRAGKALGDHDLVALDREMEKLANQREKEDRQLAKKKLEEASDAAKKGGAREVGKALDEEKKRMDQRAARTDALRELADAMKGAGEATDDVKTESEALDRQGTDKAAKSLASAMGQALEKLTPEERKRLADKLRSMAKQSGTQTMDADRMKDMAGDLSSPEGQKKLADALKDLAKDESSNERQSGEPSESARQRALDDAQKGAEGTERQLEGQEQPSQGPSEGTPSGPGASSIPIPGEGAGAGPSASAKDSPGHGGTHDRGTGDHRGSSGPVDAQSIKSRAHGSLSKGQTMPGSVTTFLPGKAGGTANVRGSGDLRIVGPSEIDGVERSDVPEEYREHVRQYFQP